MAKHIVTFPEGANDLALSDQFPREITSYINKLSMDITINPESAITEITIKFIDPPLAPPPGVPLADFIRQLTGKIRAALKQHLQNTINP